MYSHFMTSEKANVCSLGLSRKLVAILSSYQFLSVLLKFAISRDQLGR